MTTTLKAKFDGKVLVPEEAVDLPIGEILTFRREADEAAPLEDAGQHSTQEVTEGPKLTPGKTGLQRLAELAKSFGDVDLPSDFSAQHDHYLYGTPKRDDA